MGLFDKPPAAAMTMTFAVQASTATPAESLAIEYGGMARKIHRPGASGAREPADPARWSVSDLLSRRVGRSRTG
jgi:hypothetical protein